MYITRTVRGYTLVELLVVIGIIAVLTAILLPVFFHVREKGRRTTCQSNLRQVAAAMHQYIQDYDGVYPLEHFAYRIDGVSTLVSWQVTVGHYAKSREIFVCPGQGRPIPKLGVPADGYEINRDRLNVIRQSKEQAYTLLFRGVEEAELANSSTIWLNGDRVAIENSHCVNCTSGVGSCGNTIYGGTGHGGGGNFSFLDGHVKWYTPKGIAELDCQNGPIPQNFTVEE